MTPKARSWLRRGLVALLVLEGVYLLAGNLFLNLDSARELINRRPEKFEISWRRGWTVVPGWVHLREVRLRAQTRSVQWYARVDSVRGHLGLAPLLSRRLRVGGARARGVEFRLRRRLDFVAEKAREAGEPVAAAVLAARAEWLPEIPGLANLPEPDPREAYPPPRRERGWILDFEDVRAEGIREIWIEQGRFLAGGEGEGGSAGRLPGRLTARLRSQLRGPLEMEWARLDLPEGRLLFGDDMVAGKIRLAATARLHSFVPRENRGTEALRFLSGELDVEADLDGPSPADFLFRDATWVSVYARAPLVAHLVLDHGALSEGSSLDLGPGEMAVTYLDYRSAGQGVLRGRVGREADKVSSRIDAELEQFEVRRAGSDTPHVRGRGFALHAVGEELNLADRSAELEVAIHLPESEIPDLTYYNAFLPAGSGLALVSGRGTIHGDLELSTREGKGRGSIGIRASAVRGRYEDLEFRGDLELDGVLPKIEIDDRRFTLAGSRLALRNVTAAGGEEGRDWWIDLRLPEGSMRLAQPLDLDARFQATARDSGPLVALAARKKSAIRWIGGLLEVEDVEAAGRLALDGGRLHLIQTRVEGKNLELLADLLWDRQSPEGAIFLRKGRLSAAVELRDGERDWKLTNSRAWYEARIAGASKPRP